jgi:hypothetical protein
MRKRSTSSCPSAPSTGAPAENIDDAPNSVSAAEFNATIRLRASTRTMGFGTPWIIDESSDSLRLISE